MLVERIKEPLTKRLESFSEHLLSFLELCSEINEDIRLETLVTFDLRGEVKFLWLLLSFDEFLWYLNLELRLHFTAH